MNNPVLILEPAVDLEKLPSRHQNPFLFIELRVYDNIRNAGFVLHRKKDKAQRRPWPLPSNDRSSRANKLAISLSLQLKSR